MRCCYLRCCALVTIAKLWNQLRAACSKKKCCCFVNVAKKAHKLAAARLLTLAAHARRRRCGALLRWHCCLLLQTFRCRRAAAPAPASVRQKARQSSHRAKAPTDASAVASLPPQPVERGKATGGAGAWPSNANPLSCPTLRQAAAAAPPAVSVASRQRYAIVTELAPAALSKRPLHQHLPSMMH